MKHTPQPPDFVTPCLLVAPCNSTSISSDRPPRDTPKALFACRHRNRSTIDRSNLLLSDRRCLNLYLFSLPRFSVWAQHEPSVVCTFLACDELTWLHASDNVCLDLYESQSLCGCVIAHIICTNNLPLLFVLCARVKIYDSNYDSCIFLTLSTIFFKYLNHNIQISAIVEWSLGRAAVGWTIGSHLGWIWPVNQANMTHKMPFFKPQNLKFSFLRVFFITLGTFSYIHIGIH